MRRREVLGTLIGSGFVMLSSRLTTADTPTSTANDEGVDKNAGISSDTPADADEIVRLDVVTVE